MRLCDLLAESFLCIVPPNQPTYRRVPAFAGILPALALQRSCTLARIRFTRSSGERARSSRRRFLNPFNLWVRIQNKKVLRLGHVWLTPRDRRRSQTLKRANLDKMEHFVDIAKVPSPCAAGFRGSGRELCTNQKTANKRERRP